jgi:hypothetical protein
LPTIMCGEGDLLLLTFSIGGCGWDKQACDYKLERGGRGRGRASVVD